MVFALQASDGSCAMINGQPDPAKLKAFETQVGSQFGKSGFTNHPGASCPSLGHSTPADPASINFMGTRVQLFE